CLNKELMKKKNELPNRYKNPILFYYFKVFRIMDIWQNSELPMSTVKTHLRRGKEKLKGKVASIH
ncbi:MAG: RNA polymerase sigma factor, partial [Heyndrickxia sp.]